MMHVLFAVIVPLLIGSVSTSNGNYTHHRIYNGTNAKDGEFPYMVFLILGLYRPEKPSYTTCSGSLITFSTIMTAAHCVNELGPQNVVVMAGIADASNYLDFRLRNALNIPYSSKSIQESLASELHMHPKYAKKYDLAIVKIAKPFKETNFVKTISYTSDEYPGNLLCYVLGHGRNTADGAGVGTLRYFTSTAVENDVLKCGAVYKERVFYCIKQTDSAFCFGDSGGPLVCNKKLYGILSGLKYFDSDKQFCGAPVLMKIFKLSMSERKDKFLVNFARSMKSKTCKVASQFYVSIAFVVGLLFLK